MSLALPITILTRKSVRESMVSGSGRTVSKMLRQADEPSLKPFWRSEMPSRNIGGMEELRDRLTRIASGGIPGLADLCRVSELRHVSPRPNDPLFFAIRTAASELDTVPDESQRPLCSESMLAEKDGECATYLTAAADELVESAKLLLATDWLDRV